MFSWGDSLSFPHFGVLPSACCLINTHALILTVYLHHQEARGPGGSRGWGGVGPTRPWHCRAPEEGVRCVPPGKRRDSGVCIGSQQTPFPARGGEDVRARPSDSWGGGGQGSPGLLGAPDPGCLSVQLERGGEVWWARTFPAGLCRRGCRGRSARLTHAPGQIHMAPLGHSSPSTEDFVTGNKFRVGR